MKTCIIIGAGGRGKDSYAPYIHDNNLMKIVGVVEPDDYKREQFKKHYSIDENMCFTDYRELFKLGKLADAVIIADAEEAAGAQDVNYDLEGIWDEYNSSTGLVDRNTFSPLELIGMDFDVCRPVYSDYLADMGYKNAIGDMKYSDPIPFTMDLSVEDTVLPAGQYRLRYAMQVS